MESMFLFGEDDKPQITNCLSDRFGENPFSVLHTQTGRWQDCERAYKALGIKSDFGRDAKAFNVGKYAFKYMDKSKPYSDTSIFSPKLTQLIYQWFCPIDGAILDPFSGGSVRGIVAGLNDYDYTGIDIRAEQVAENERQVEALASKLYKKPKYICGDSRGVLDTMDKDFDLVFSCPPYADLEVYSDLDGDISNMDYDRFLEAYTDIIKKSCDRLKDGCFAVFVVGEIRDKDGFYRGFVPDTICAFKQAEMNYYNEIILENVIGTACLRTKQFNASRKIVKTHQNVLVFVKGKPDMGRKWRVF